MNDIRSLKAGLVMWLALLMAACGGGNIAMPPTVQISSNVTGTATGPLSFNFNFSDDVGSSFTAASVAVSNGSAGLFTRLAANRYSLAVTPPANASGNIVITLAGDKYRSIYDLPGEGTTTAIQAFDTAAPALAISSSASGIAAGQVSFTFRFSEDVGSSFTASDVLVGFSGVSGQVQTLTRISATVASLVVTSPAATTGRISVRVPAAAFNDLAGNANLAETLATQDFDTVAPTVAVGSSAAGQLVASGPFSFTFTFSEDVGSSFTSDDVVLVFNGGSGGSKGALTRISATQASLLVTPPVGAAGNVSVSIAVAAFSDLAGNTNALSYFGVQQYDTRP